MLYATYGDFAANTGPIDVVAVDLSGPTPTIVTGPMLATEETWNVRAVSGGVIVPHVDPMGGQTSTAHYSRFDGVWHTDQSVTPIPEHVMDAAETADGLWLFGASYGTNPSTGGAATVWRSADNGATWAASLLIDDPDNTGFARAYLGVVLGDTVLAVVTDSGTDRTFQWSAGAWTEITSVGGLTDGVPFQKNGTPYWLCRALELDEARAAPFPITVVSGDSDVKAAMQAAIPNQFYIALASTENYAWLLGLDAELYCVAPDGAVAAVQTVDTTDVTAMAVDEAGGWVYLGTSDSKIYRCPLTSI